MSGYLVTSSGQSPTATWACHRCPGEGTASSYDGGAGIRAAAAAHVEKTGHQVMVIRGTSELLLPLATTAPVPAPKELTR